MSVNTPTRGATMQFSTLNKVGFVLALLLGLVNVLALASPTLEGEVGPPMLILIVDAVLGVFIIAAVLIGWLRGNRAAIRAAAVPLVLAAITALPAFTNSEVPRPLVVVAGIYVLLTIVALVLMFKPARQV